MVETRIALDVPQHVVAERMGTTQPSVARLESGIADPRLSTLQRYTRALGLKVAIRLTAPDGRSSHEMEI